MIKLQQRKYFDYYFSHLLTSQFISKSSKDLPKLKNVFMTSNKQSWRTKKIHFLYLFLITKVLPQVDKVYLSSKARSLPVNRNDKENRCLKVIVQKRNQYSFTNNIFVDLSTFQQKLEYSIYNVHEDMVDLVLINPSLTFNTSLLQSNNFYRSQLSFNLHLLFSNCSFFEKLFLLRSWKFIKRENISGLE